MKGAAFFLAVVLFCFVTTAGTPPAVFRFHTFREPESLNPLKQRTSNSGYVTSQIFWPPLRWHKGQIEPGFLKSCRPANKSQKIWECDWNPEIKFSNGDILKPQDFVGHLRQAVSSANASPLASELMNLKNAPLIFAGKMEATRLGIQLRNQKVVFELIEPDSEFPLRLINPLLSPFKNFGDKILGTGPYYLKTWLSGQKLTLAPNPHFKPGHPERPDVEVLFQSEDNIAVKLYQNNELTFLRRLPTLYFEKYKANPEFHRIQQIRMDYLGFSKKFREAPESLKFRKALSENFPYTQMGELLHSRPRPGCFGLPTEWTQGQVCIPEKNSGKTTEKANLKNTDSQLALDALKNKSLRTTFSQNIDDHKRVFEWMQSQLKTSFSLNLILDGIENKAFLEKVNRREVDFFRKGLAPDRPSCLALLENFLPMAADNFVDYENPKFIRTVSSLKNANGIKSKARFCRQALEILRNDYVVIPTGPIDFAVLVKPGWEGWSLNEINQLDLSQLHFKSKN